MGNTRKTVTTTPISEIVKSNHLNVKVAADVVAIRQAVRALAVEIGLNLVEQTKIITAASELGRNTIIHGGGGDATLEIVRSTDRLGLRLAFEDKGPGIANLEQALRDGFTTGTGLGLGLGGAKRLSSEFHIESEPGVGTKITILRWKG
jgi:serine/threonine-protein kinase RsbT